MSRAKNIKGIVYHCSAGYAGVKGIEAFWRRPKPAGPGWRGKGYSIIIELDGTTWYLKDPYAVNGYSKDPADLNLEAITNGVRGHNSDYISICTIGGVEPDNVTKAKDTRTPQQIGALHSATQLVIKWLGENEKDLTKDFGIYGHREFSKDSNGNGVIEPWERIKECPSWDVIGSEFHYVYSSKDRYSQLPT